MSVTQTVRPKENEAIIGAQGFVRTEEAHSQTPAEIETFLTREQAVVELLEVHAEEENRRQKCLARYRIAILTVVPLSLLLGGVSSYFQSFPAQALSKATVGLLITVAMLLMAAGNLLAQWYFAGWRRYTPLPNSLCAVISDVKEEDFTPLFSSPMQQNIITAMLYYPDEPRIAEALCRALDYYCKDKNLLYVRLARLLLLLPNDGSALSETARRILFNVSKRTVEHDTGNDKEQTLPILQAAAKAYFARTGEPAPSIKRRPRTNA